MRHPLFLNGLLRAAPAFAETPVPTIFPEQYEAGRAARFDRPKLTDLFMAGNLLLRRAAVMA